MQSYFSFVIFFCLLSYGYAGRKKNRPEPPYQELKDLLGEDFYVETKFVLTPFQVTQQYRSISNLLFFFVEG